MRPKIFTRSLTQQDVEKTVADIIADVRENGDTAVLKYTERFDKAALTTLEVTAEELDAALASADPKLIEILKKAAVNIEAFHSRQKREGFVINGDNGIVTGQRILPLERGGRLCPRRHGLLSFDSPHELYSGKACRRA